jgi:hypothetical protein
MGYQQETLGQVVERLINIKDRFANSLSFEEKEAINNACNIIDHKFDRHATANEVIYGKEE